MFWNMINDMAYKYGRVFHSVPTHVYMPRWFYDNLEREMVGDQWWFLIRNSKVRGMSIIIDNEVPFLKIVGDDVLEVKGWSDSKWV